MTYPQLTVFNYKITYYLFRVFTVFWMVEQLLIFNKTSKRATELYEPSVWLQKLIMPSFPSNDLYYSLLAVTLILLIYTLFKFSILINVLLFILVSIISLPIVAYHGVSHTNHLLILAYFFSIFLNPKTLRDADYKYVQLFYLGLLSTYSLAGLWKILSAVKDFITRNPDVSWFEINAAKYNTMLNYMMVDRKTPEWILNLYEFENLWVVITILGITFQTLSFLGAFNRKYLTFTLIFLIIFHFYTVYFVIADLKIMKYGLIVLFFPYHYFQQWIERKFLNLKFNPKNKES